MLVGTSTFGSMFIYYPKLQLSCWKMWEPPYRRKSFICFIDKFSNIFLQLFSLKKKNSVMYGIFASSIFSSQFPKVKNYYRRSVKFFASWKRKLRVVQNKVYCNKWIILFKCGNNILSSQSYIQFFKIISGEFNY